MEQLTGYVGIDVSKDTLDVFCLKEKTAKEVKGVSETFSNDAKGFSKLLRWCQFKLSDRQLHFGMESTGNYSRAIAEFLVENNQFISMLNPARVKAFASSLGVGNKTDPVDARTIALFCHATQPVLWRMAESEIQELTALVRHLQNLQTNLLQINNRLGDPGLVSSVQSSLKKTQAFLLSEIKLIEEQINRHIDNTPSLKGDKELLRSIPGIGEKLAHSILAELPSVEQFENAKAVAAYAGLAPRQFRSGSSVNRKTRISKTGNSNLRKALYMPALSAKTHNPFVRDMYNRLVERGTAKKAALIAAMRKLLMIAYGVLKSRTPFTIMPCNASA